MAQATATPPVTANDRLGMTVLLAAILHGIIILGVTFTDDDADDNTAPTLDVILVQSSHSSEPLEADYLAQVSQDGGGNTDKKVRPTDLFSAPTLAEAPGIAPEQSVASITQLKQKEQQRVLTQQKADYSINTEKKPTDAEEQNNPNPQTPDFQAQVARLAAEIDRHAQEYAKRPRKKFLNSRTREHIAAGYMRQWIDRVERIGNLNYPDAAIRDKLSGTLIMDVVINSEGELVEYALRRSSGYKVLDDAARRIVKLAAPYSAFPEPLKHDTDVIHITRSWVFESSNRLITR